MKTFHNLIVQSLTFKRSPILFLSIPLIHRLRFSSSESRWNCCEIGGGGSPFLEIVHNCCEIFCLFLVASLTNCLKFKLWVPPSLFKSQDASKLKKKLTWWTNFDKNWKYWNLCLTSMIGWNLLSGKENDKLMSGTGDMVRKCSKFRNFWLFISWLLIGQFKTILLSDWLKLNP